MNFPLNLSFRKYLINFLKAMISPFSVNDNINLRLNSLSITEAIVLSPCLKHQWF